MSSEDPNQGGTTPADEKCARRLSELFESQWDALRRGEHPDPQNWTGRHPDGVQGLPDLEMLRALHEVDCVLREDCRLVFTPPFPGDAIDADGDLAAAFATTVDYTPPAAPSASRAGDKIGKYEIKEVLGRGGQATTFKAWDPDVQRHVVLKLYHAAAAPEQCKQVVEEGQKLARVRNRYVVTCFGVEWFGNVPYLVLEYVPGKSLDKVHREKPLGVAQALELIRNIAGGLHIVHARGMLHRDIKPANILMGDDGLPRLVDFGLARPLGDAALADPTGTPAYMAPEQACGDLERAGPPSDIFGLGATLYFLLAGSAPYQGTTRAEACRLAREGHIVPPRARSPKVRRDVNRLCLRCLAKAPEGRFESAKDLARAIFLLKLRRYLMPTVAGLAVLVLAAVFVSRFFPSGSLAGSAAISQATLPSAPQTPLRIESVEFAQFVLIEQDKHEPQGVVRRDPYRLKLGDAVQFRARLSRPAYCYWIAFRPDGKEEICFPEDPRQPPPLTDAPVYPVEDRELCYSLAEGVGVQAFALLVSEQPLPPYDEWRQQRGTSPWQSTHDAPLKAIQVHSDDWVHEIPIDGSQPKQHRGAGARLQGKPSPLDDLVGWLRSDKHFVAVEVWALPVLPRRDGLNSNAGK